jgi:hypothetical protein
MTFFAIASAIPSCSIILPMCVPLGVFPGVAWTTDRAASMASRNLSFVEISGFGAPSFTTTLVPTMPNVARLLSRNLPSLA